MKVSIVIPVYNVQDYLAECIRSVLKLKTETEIILVDDGSTDNSGTLCDEWAGKDARIRVIHQTNGGLSAARNTGIQAATGEYILFLDSDDFIDPEETDCLLNELDPDVELALGLYRNYYSEGHRYEKENCSALLSLDGVMPMDDFLAAIPADGQESYMTAWRFVISRAFLNANSLLFMQGIYHEDEEWTHRVFCCADRVQVTHHYFYQYRQARAGAITSGVKPKHIFDEFTILERAEGLIQAHSDNAVKSRYLRYRMASMYLNSMIHFYSLKGEDRQRAYRQLVRFHDSCAGNLSGGIGKAVKLCDRFLGIRATCWLLRLARKIKTEK